MSVIADFASEWNHFAILIYDYNQRECGGDDCGNYDNDDSVSACTVYMAG